MKNNKILAVVVVAMAALLLSSVPVLAQAVKTDFTGTRTPDPPPVDLGYSVYSDEADTGTCDTSRDDCANHVRDRVLEFSIVTDDPRLTGTQTIVLSADLEPYGYQDGVKDYARSGQLRGTFSIVLNGDKKPSWEGTFTGRGNSDGYWYHIYVGNGKGKFKKLKLYAFSENSDRGPKPAGKIWDINGYILSPGKKIKKKKGDDDDD